MASQSIQAQARSDRVSDEAILARARALATELGHLLGTAPPHLNSAIMAEVIQHVLARFRSRLLADLEVPPEPPSARRPRRKG